MPLDKELLDILVCPESKEPLIYFADESYLYCPASRLKYPIRDDIPVMLIDEAERLDEARGGEVVAEAKKRGLWPG
jgi:uncharacterized protein YbaR (Trm112 family)